MIQRILVWDLPTRIFHWSLALSFAGAYLTAESERWAALHLLFGYTLLLLLAFRLIWGMTGTRYARFGEFVRGPRKTLGYLRGMLRGRPEPSVGHNPAASVAIVLLLLLGIASGVSGWAIYNDWVGDWGEEWHEVTAELMLAVVGLHVIGVLVSSRLHRENLVLAMITGRKTGAPMDAIPSAKPWVALILVAGLAGFWAWSLANPDQSLAVVGGIDAGSEHPVVAD